MLFDHIDMRSFSSLWYWLVLVAVWSRVGLRVLGVPQDILFSAMQGDAQSVADVDGLGEFTARRLVAQSDRSGLWISALLAFGLTVLCLLAFVYDVELAQALFLLAVPLLIIRWLTLRSARLVVAQTQQGDPLHRTITRLRWQIQLVAISAIFVTTLYGMFQTVSIRPF